MTEILIEAYNKTTGCFETIDREAGTREDFDLADLSANDLGCMPGDVIRLVLVDEQSQELASREVQTR